MEAVDLGKDRFLGRETLAAIDASTPLRTVVVAVETSEPVSPGELLTVAGQPAGELTSVTGMEDRVLGLARIYWELRAGPFSTESGRGSSNTSRRTRLTLPGPYGPSLRWPRALNLRICRTCSSTSCAGWEDMESVWRAPIRPARISSISPSAERRRA